MPSVLRTELADWDGKRDRGGSSPADWLTFYSTISDRKNMYVYYNYN